MKAAWRHIEKHHERYGVALFIVPALLVAWALTGIFYGLAWVLQ